MVLHVAPGRLLRWSPVWPAEEASVLFDSNSGDFWVLDLPTRELLMQIASHPGLTSDTVLAQGHWAAQSLDEVLASLVAAGVLRAEPAGHD